MNIHEIILKLDNLSIGYAHIPIQEDLHLEVGVGQYIAITGRNGLGKTTLLNTIAGLTPKLKGNMFFETSDINQLSTYALAGKGMRYLPDNKGLFKNISVEQNLTIAKKEGHFHLEMVLDLFPRLRSRLSNLSGTLSGGEQQMLAISQMLLANPKLGLIDELSEGLQPDAIQSLLDFLEANRQASGMSLLFVEQRINVVKALSDGAIVFRANKAPEYIGRNLWVSDEALLENLIFN
ncbi:hypothetical protein BFP97_17800 [Roseivirga sp. 4D4]|uniref:ATP-binding cassette domain-containing protein n=1 Tax=Roseivirga sp. 4D4 TaxID=1889784 RepID=UPI00085366C5|nr:ATP-binding cassette domain-containing protein [Roseivirga sp. 4D4]OEK03264.1 hypothetical protein BFP97_17800 [Roseivirga sp. 4D4]